MRIGYLCAALVLAASCGSSTKPADGPPNGMWIGNSSGVDVVLTLAWSADSVKGTGSWDASSSTLGCGGAALSGNGQVTFKAARTGQSVSGFMSFDTGWSPPYTGTVSSDGNLAGEFRSIDAGGCAFTLHHVIPID